MRPRSRLSAQRPFSRRPPSYSTATHCSGRPHEFSIVLLCWEITTGRLALRTSRPLPSGPSGRGRSLPGGYRAGRVLPPHDHLNDVSSVHGAQQDFAARGVASSSAVAFHSATTLTSEERSSSW
jgi:hypothetical protein